jgi:iron complex transport system ATP-binding protein
MEDAPRLECRDLACGYPGRIVLEGVGLSLRAGVVMALLGPNGSGKSTLLKTLCKSLPPVAGDALLSGVSIRQLSHADAARRVAYVPQEEEPRFAFTVRELVTMGRLPLSGGLFDTLEDRIAAEAAMKDAACLDLAERPITELSGGERQRALLGRALAQNAPLLLLDEPTSHLDVGHQVAAVTLLRKLAVEGRSVLVAVHDLNLASALADEAALLSGGRVALSGPTRELLSDPRLDDVYGVRFERTTADDGTLRVLPAFGTPYFHH